MKRKSINDLKETAKLRRIKNSHKLKKEALITSILKSESSNTERNYMKNFNIILMLIIIIMLMIIIILMMILMIVK